MDMPTLFDCNNPGNYKQDLVVGRYEATTCSLQNDELRYGYDFQRGPWLGKQQQYLGIKGFTKLAFTFTVISLSSLTSVFEMNSKALSGVTQDGGLLVMQAQWYTLSSEYLRS